MAHLCGSVWLTSLFLHSPPPSYYCVQIAMLHQLEHAKVVKKQQDVESEYLRSAKEEMGFSEDDALANIRQARSLPPENAKLEVLNRIYEANQAVKEVKDHETSFLNDMQSMKRAKGQVEALKFSEPEFEKKVRCTSVYCTSFYYTSYIHTHPMHIIYIESRHKQIHIIVCGPTAHLHGRVWLTSLLLHVVHIIVCRSQLCKTSMMNGWRSKKTSMLSWRRSENVRKRN